MKIIKSAIKNNKIHPISEQEKQLILENAMNASNLRLSREYQRRSQQSTADILKAMQKMNQIAPQPIVLVQSQSAVVKPGLDVVLMSQQQAELRAGLVSAPAAPIISKEIGFFEAQEQRLRELKVAREWERRAEQSVADKAKAQTPKLMPTAKSMVEEEVVSSKKKATKLEVVSALPKVLSFFEAQNQAIKALKLEREMQRRAEQSQMDKQKAKQKRSIR